MNVGGKRGVGGKWVELSVENGGGGVI
jgi:hypothetical protein